MSKVVVKASEKPDKLLVVNEYMVRELSRISGEGDLAYMLNTLMEGNYAFEYLKHSRGSTPPPSLITYVRLKLGITSFEDAYEYASKLHENLVEWVNGLQA